MEPHRTPTQARGARVLGRLGAWLLRGLAATWRVQREGPDPFASDAPFVAALWHRGLFIAAGVFRDRGAVVPVSLSRDGERIDAVLVRLGFGRSARGSSSRGGPQALAGMIRAVREGRAVGVLCDGPRGPAGRAKAGALAAARATGAPLYPVGLAARPALRFGSWDRVVLPVPFARVGVVFGPPLGVPREAPREQLDGLRAQLEAALDRSNQRAESAAAGRRDALAVETGG